MTSTSRSNPFQPTPVKGRSVPSFSACAAQPVPSAVSRRSLIYEEMLQCRQLTLDLFEGIDYDTLTRQAHADFSPIGWHLGHIAYTESLWLLEHCAGQPCQFPQYRHLFAADGLPKAERVKLPSLAEIQAYLARIREAVFRYLEVAPFEQEERLWRFLLQHESQHAETIAIVLELLRRQDSPLFSLSSLLPPPPSPLSPPSSFLSPPPSPLSLPDMVFIPAGNFTCGSDSMDALDNERPAHVVYLDSYWIDRYPVTCGQYRLFMEAGGYQQACWWSAAGWEWLQSAQVSQPLYWKGDPEWDDHPVCGVSWYEADAYARFAGKRLPTELEWEKAARWHPEPTPAEPALRGEVGSGSERCNHSHQIGQTTPVTYYPAGKSPAGCYDMLGNVWEWTSSWFAGYEGFEPYPYRGYSQVYFDHQHRVLRGGSWATRPWALRASFRNWYHPQVRQVLAGFRCAAGDEGDAE